MEYDSDDGMIDAILEWAEDKNWFDVSFVESVKEFLSEKGYLTSLQYDALERIIEKFKIR